MFDNVNWLTLIQILPTICFSYIMRDVSANCFSLRRFGIFFLPKRPLTCFFRYVFCRNVRNSYQQTDGVAMGASLAVILANLWLKEYEHMIFSENPSSSDIPVYDKCPKCSRKVLTKNRGFECDRCQF